MTTSFIIGICCGIVLAVALPHYYINYKIDNRSEEDTWNL